jgi:CheY-like chemotaxis protein
MMNRAVATSIAKIAQSEFIPLAGFRERSERKGIAKGLHVLIVEDHEASRNCLKGLLQKEGYSICSFPCAEDGLGELEADCFDVLLTDLHLPGMDGFELITKAKAAQPSIHILMMTAVASNRVREQAQAVGVDAVMEKPIELDQLLAFLESIQLNMEQVVT